MLGCVSLSTTPGFASLLRDNALFASIFASSVFDTVVRHVLRGRSREDHEENCGGGGGAHFGG
jgi:hypothetical protein